MLLQAQFITIVIDAEQRVYQEQLGETIKLPIDNNEDTIELLQVGFVANLRRCPWIYEPSIFYS